jgi:hypothetical protein
MRFAAAALFVGAVAAVPWALPGEESIVYLTETDTITSCGPTITNCPANATPYATPAAETSASPETTAAPVYTTSTVYSTTEIVVTSCAPTVISCPAESTVVVTSTIALYTTICPVTATESPVETATANPTETAAPVPAETASPTETAAAAPTEAAPTSAAAVTVAPVPTGTPYVPSTPANGT